VSDGTPVLVDEDSVVRPGDSVLVACPTELTSQVRAAFRGL
jgi:hypothetical protein